MPWTGRPGDRVIRPWRQGRVPRKVRAPQSKVVGNTHPEQSAGQCHREQTASSLSRGEVRVKRWSKSPPAPRATGTARQTPPGARPDSVRPRAARPSTRVGRRRPSATAVVDRWSPITEPGLQVGPSPICRLTCGNSEISRLRLERSGARARRTGTHAARSGDVRRAAPGRKRPPGKPGTAGSRHGGSSLLLRGGALPTAGWAPGAEPRRETSKPRNSTQTLRTRRSAASTALSSSNPR